MKKKAIKVIGFILLIAGIMLIAAGTIFQIRAEKNGFHSNITQMSAQFETPRELVVITNDLPITVRYGDTDTVDVSYTSGLPLIFSEEGGTLKITQDDMFSVSIFTRGLPDLNVTITLPHKVYKRIGLAASSGSVIADSLNADSIDISTKGGDIAVYNMDERTSLRTDSGEIDAYFSSISSDMTINAGDGDVRLYVSKDMLFGLQFFTESGRFSSAHFSEIYDSRFGDAVILGGGAKKVITVNTASGNLYIIDN